VIYSDFDFHQNMAETPISTSLAAVTALLSLSVPLDQARYRPLLKSLFQPMHFSSYTETICGLALLYKLRLFEQQWGSKKYSNFVLITNGVSTLISYSLIAGFRRSITSLQCGPYGVIVASLVQFYLDVPTIATSEHASISALVCLLAIKISLSSRLNALVTTVSGILAGIAYRHPKIRSLKLPGTGFISDTCKRIVPFLLKSSDSHSHRGLDSTPHNWSSLYQFPSTQSIIAPHVLGRQLLEGGNGANRQTPSGLPRTPQSQGASRAALDTLAGMGFHDARRNEHLLTVHGGDLAHVIEHLLH
jgi:hypothetical protein